MSQNDAALSARTQRLIKHLNEVLQEAPAFSEPPHKHVQVLLLSLPEPYHTMAIQAIAERIVSEMKLQMLEIVSIFSRHAEQEGINEDERNEALQDVEADTLQLMQSSKQLTIHNIEDLLTLSNITTGLRSLSQAQNAGQAQSWMYKLPAMYLRKLQQEQLITAVSFRFNLSPPNPKNDAGNTSRQK